MPKGSSFFLPLLLFFLGLYFFLSSPSEPATPSTIEALAPVEVVAEGQQELVGLAVAPDGSVYFSDRMGGVVYKLRPSEPPVTVLDGLQRPAGLALDAEGRLLIAEEMAGQILRLEADGALTVLASGIKTPRWIAASPDGSLYISAHRLQAPDGPDETEGREILRLGLDGSLTVVASNIRRLEGLAFLNGDLVAATKGLESGTELAGALLRYPVLADGSLGQPVSWVDTGLKQPVGLMRDRLGTPYLSSKELTDTTDTAKRAVGKILPGPQLSVFAKHLTDPQGLAFGPDGSLYLADGKEGRLIRFRAPPAPGLIFPSFTNRSPLLVHGATEPNSRVDAFLNNAGFATIFTQDGAFALDSSLVLNAQNTLVLFSTGQNGNGLSSAPAEAIITHDSLAPVITNLQPIDGSFINNPTPVIRADFNDSLSGINPSSAQIIVDGANVTSRALISASGFTFTPGSLSEGAHTVSVTVADRAGNSASVSSTFSVDLTSPQIVNLTPADGSTVTSAQPPVSANFSDNLSGINLASVSIALDGTDVTLQATINSSGFSMTPTTPLTQGPHTVFVSLSDVAGNAASATSAFNLSLGPQIPPDPATVAPPIDRTVSTDLGSATEFLYTGSNPIQTGVALGTIEARRAAVLRGKVFDRDGSALSGVMISILNHPEFGSTLSRTDGAFDMAVNGGSALTVRYEKSGFLPAQRQITVPWQDYALLPDVVLVPLAPQVTTIDLSANTPIQVAQGTPVTDADGSRRATLLFRQGTQATMAFPDGSGQTLTNPSVRATEYTVGPNGRASMPAELPPTSGYTYAVEFSVDEAIAAGAKEVRFNQPIINYTDNFLNFPVGGIVPAGFYDRERGIWVPSENGRVIKIISISGGLADLDTDGDGSVDNGVALGVIDAERQQLAFLYQPGKSLWRVPITHFSPRDYNWPYGPPAGAQPPNQPPIEDVPQNAEPLDDPACAPGSIIECQNQILGEAVGITGTPFRLHYQSDRVPGRKAANGLTIPLSGASVPASLKRIELEIHVAGQRFIQNFLPLPNQTTVFTWNGEDAYGRELQGSQAATIRTGYVYDAIYQRPAEFQQTFAALSGVPLIGSVARQEFTLFQQQRLSISGVGTWDARGQGLGGWTLSVHHAYDVTGKVLHQGDGRRRNAKNIGSVITRVAGGGTSLGDGGPAVNAQIFARGIAVDGEGNLFIADTSNHRIRKVDGNGIITTVAGTGTSGFSGDGGPAINADLNLPFGLAADEQGNLFIADTLNNRVRRVSPDGIIMTVAGNGTEGFSGDRGPAISAQLNLPFAVVVDSHGNLFIADRFNNRIRKVGPDGTITTVAGGGTTLGDFGPAASASISDPQDIAVDEQGNLFIPDIRRVRKVSTSGIITTVAGNGTDGFSGDGGPATNARISPPVGVAVDGQGNLFIADLFNNRIRRVSPDGIITTVAGNGSSGLGGDGGLAANAQLGFPDRVRVDKEDNLLIVQGTVVRKVQPLVPGFSGQAITIASEDGRELYGFEGTGRHLRTLDALTGAIRYEFSYDAAGRLNAVMDGDGNVTAIERDANGNPAAIVASGGQRTTLSLDTSGYLATFTDPGGNTNQYGYSSDGLLTTMRDARGGLYQFGYDSLGRLARHEDPAGGFSTLARTDSTTGFEVSLTTALGRTNKYLVESLSTGGTKRTNTDPSGARTIVQIGTDGSRVTTPPDGTVTTLLEGPDPRFGMQAPLASSLRVATPAGRVSLTTTTRSVTLTDPNNLLSLASLTDTTAINGRTFTSTYDAAQRRFTNTSPLGLQRFTILDTRGRVVQNQISGLEPDSFTYDAQGRLTTITRSSGPTARIQTISYDALNRVSSITDPLGRTTSFIYDLADRVTTQILPDGREIRFIYDANGNVTSIRPPGRPAHLFGFTPVNLEQTYNPPDVGLPGDTTIYTYNSDKQLTRVLRPDGETIDLGYDTGGRLSTMTLSRGQIVYGYHPTTGNLTSITAPDGGTMSYTYDGSLLTSTTWSGTVTGSVGFTYNNDFRVTSEIINGGNGVSFTYDNDGLLTQAGSLTLSRNAQNGLLTGSTLGNVTDSLSYNTFGEPTNYQAAYSGATFFNAQYTRDNLGRITQKVETIQGATDTFEYSHDLAGRLTEVKKNGTVIASYSYDSNGNRLSLTTFTGTVNGTYDDQDRLLSYGSATYTYSANGELASKTVGGQTTTYSYDALGNLLAVTLPGGTHIEYIADGKSRRVGKKVNGVLAQGFLYQNELRPVAELDGNNNLVSRFIYASKANVPDHMIKGGVTYRIISDHLGSPTLVVDVSTGVPAQQLDYDEFGNVILDTNPGFQPFGFAGGLYDPDTKLTRFRTRDYDPETGRWTAKDPLRFSGGDTNLLAYLANGPVDSVDPFGFINILVGGGGSATAPTGIEGSGGIVFNPGLFGQQADIGVFGSIGAGGGVNVSGDVFLGFVRGGIENVGGLTANINLTLGPVSITTLTNPVTGEAVGVTFGLGPSAIPIGASGTISQTGTLTLRDFLEAIRGRILQPQWCSR